MGSSEVMLKTAALQSNNEIPNLPSFMRPFDVMLS
jgi:hypothetical protein